MCTDDSSFFSHHPGAFWTTFDVYVLHHLNCIAHIQRFLPARSYLKASSGSVKDLEKDVTNGVHKHF